MQAQRINREAIASTYQAIRSHVRRTPVIDVTARELGLRLPNRIVFKLELFQHAGSFKARGAFANMVCRDVPSAGVTAASGGNHGAAVAFAAQELGHKATIFVPEIASPAKIARIRDCGAELVIRGERYADALEACRAFAAESGALDIHAYDQRETLLGQGSVALELETQAPTLGALLVAVGGGGLIGGITAWTQGRTSVVAVEPEMSCALNAALDAGRPVDVDVGGMAADSLGARRVGDLMFPLAQAFVEDVVLVTDDDIRAAQRLLWEKLRIAAEPGGVTALAALMSGRFTPRDEAPVGVLICGGNTDAVDFPN